MGKRKSEITITWACFGKFSPSRGVPAPDCGEDINISSILANVLLLESGGIPDPSKATRSPPLISKEHNPRAKTKARISFSGSSGRDLKFMD